MRGIRTYRIIFEETHGFRGARAGVGVEEARHGLRQQPDDNDTGFPCVARAVFSIGKG